MRRFRCNGAPVFSLRLPAILLGALLLVLMLGGITSRGATAQDSEPTLEITPDTLEVPLGRPVHVHVVLHNGTASTLRSVELTIQTDTGVTILPTSPQRLGTLRAGADFGWTFSLSRDTEGTLPGTIYFRVDYVRHMEAEDAGTPEVLLQQLTLTSPALPEVSEVASVEIKSSTLSINEKHAGQLYLVITNTSADVITIKPVITHGPDFVKFDVSGVDEAGTSVGPGESRAIQIDVSADDAVQPGNYLLLFETPIVWMAGGQEQSDNIISTQEVEITVFGESAILTALAVPAFLLLPGMLALFTAQLAWGWGRKKDEETDFPLSFPSSEFWVIAITISLLSAIVYPWASRVLLNENRDYTDRYGLIDIIRVWFVAVILTVVVVFAFNAIVGTIRSMKARKQAREEERRATELSERTIAEGDGPFTVLEKLGRRQESIILPRVTVTRDVGQPESLFVLGRSGDADNQQFTVGPRILYTWTSNAREAQQLAGQVDTLLLSNDAMAARLVPLLKQGLEKQFVALNWDRATGSIHEPAFVPVDTAVQSGQDRLVQAR